MATLAKDVVAEAQASIPQVRASADDAEQEAKRQMQCLQAACQERLESLLSAIASREGLVTDRIQP